MTGATLDSVCVYLFAPVRGRLASGDSARSTVAESVQWMSALQPGHQTIVPAVSVADGLRQVAVASVAQLVVVGSGRSRSLAPFARRPARDLLRGDSPFAVVTAPVGFALRRDSGVRRIAVIDDGTDGSELALLLAGRLAERMCCDLQRLDRSAARRLRPQARWGLLRAMRALASLRRPAPGSPPDLVVIPDREQRRVARLQRAPFRMLSRGCTVPAVFVCRGLDPSSFMAGRELPEVAPRETGSPGSSSSGS